MAGRARARVALAASVVGLAASVVGLAGCGDGRVTATDRVAEQGFVAGDGVVTVYAPEDRQPAPDFRGPLLGGGPAGATGDPGEPGERADYVLADDLGSVVALNVWGSWCAPCRKEAPALARVSEDLADDGVRFVGVNTRDASEEPARGFVEEFGIGYPNVYDPKGEALLAFRDTLPAAAIPSTLVVDRQGRMAARVVGVADEQALTELLRDLAAEPAE
jgi:thiol-disulfide isomerase/thioredoxin